MPSTTTHGLPVPVSTDSPAGHTQITSLAAALDTQLLTTVTSLPGSPVDGQRCLFLADSTNGVVWDLRYRSASGSAYKWEYVGGAPLGAEAVGATSTTSSSYVDAPDGLGPSITLPLAGDYRFDYGAHGIPAASSLCRLAPKFGTAAVDGNDVILFNSSVQSARVGRLHTVTAASTVVKLQYESDASGTATAIFENRVLIARPTRVG